MESSPITYELDPLCRQNLQIYSYRNVKNIKQLLSKAREGSLNCALLNPKIIYDPFQIAIAANKAAIASLDGTMKTRSIHSEIIFNLSPSKNITKSLTTFGMDASAEYPKAGVDLSLAIICENGSEIPENISTLIDGDMCPFESICNKNNLEFIKKNYNIRGDDNTLRIIATICASK